MVRIRVGASHKGEEDDVVFFALVIVDDSDDGGLQHFVHFAMALLEPQYQIELTYVRCQDRHFACLITHGIDEVEGQGEDEPCLKLVGSALGLVFRVHFVFAKIVLQEENRTMVPAINAFLGTTQTEGNVMFAVAAVVSATAPLFVLVMFFQRQIVSGLTAGAVKG